jgi:hypothetical protein
MKLVKQNKLGARKTIIKRIDELDESTNNDDDVSRVGIKDGPHT